MCCYSRIGWSVQVPARRAAERDEAAIATSREETWPVPVRTAADLSAWLCWEDESGQGLRPPKGRTWGRRGRTPVVTVTGGHNTRVSLAALIATRPGSGPRLIYRTHLGGRRDGRRKGFTETGYARLLDAAHQQLHGPIVLVWDYVPRHIIPVLCPAVLCGRRWLAALVACGDELGAAVAAT